MALVNIAKDDTKPLFIDASDITALQIVEAGKEIIIYNGQGRLLHAGVQDWNLDVADVVSKLENSGAPLLPFTTSHQDKTYSFYIAPSAVTYATVTLPGKDGTVGAIVGVRGMGRAETWDGGMAQGEFDNLIAAVRKTKTLFEYKPEVAYSRWYNPAVLYIDPASVVRMRGSFNYDQIDVSFDNSGSLDVQVAYHNQFDPKTSFEQKAVDIYNDKKYTGPHKGMAAINDILEQLRKEAFQTRVDFVGKIAAANSDLLDISTQTQAAFLMSEDIGMVSFYEARDSNAPGLYIRSQEKQGGSLGETFSLEFNTAAERESTLAVLLQGKAPKAKTKPGLKP